MTKAEFYTSLLEDENIPIFGVSCGQSSTVINFKDEATDEQRLKATEIVQTIEATPDNVNNRELLLTKRNILNKLSSNDPTFLLIRGVMRIVFSSIVETRLAINEIMAKNPSLDMTPLVNKSWGELVNIAAQEIIE
jgi:hypothetical protein